MGETGGGGAARVGSVSTLRVGSDARVGSVHCGDARVGSLLSLFVTFVRLFNP